jgi:hypothetical protein
MPKLNPYQKRNELIAARKKELLSLGYKPGIIDLAMEWAVSSAEGMARYGLKLSNGNDPEASIQELTVQFLPQFLSDAEKYMRSFGHDRGETVPGAQK